MVHEGAAELSDKKHYTFKHTGSIGDHIEG